MFFEGKLYQKYSSSCANHFIQHRMNIRFSLEEVDENYILPLLQTTEESLIELSDCDKEWIYGYGAACPESFNRDQSIGYLYLAGGVKLKNIRDTNALILICPSENHHNELNHIHALTGTLEQICYTNDEIIDLLEYSIQMGDTKKINYSKGSLSIMKTELEKRNKL